ncbi:hypothetical protein GCM10029992_34800 [Glycomyces albus]
MSTRKPKARRLGLRALAVGFVAAVLGAVGTASPASASGSLFNYVAIGDSYVSGVGAGDYEDEECYRSDNAYPVQASEEIREKLWFDACSGATVDDVVADQLDHLDFFTRHVTIGVGGNDAGFSSVLTACAGTDTELCLGAVEGARTYMTDQLPQSLDGLYTQVRDEAVFADIIVVGNPRLFSGDTCQGTLAITPRSRRRSTARRTCWPRPPPRSPTTTASTSSTPARPSPATPCAPRTRGSSATPARSNPSTPTRPARTPSPTWSFPTSSTADPIRNLRRALGAAEGPASIPGIDSRLCSNAATH